MTTYADARSTIAGAIAVALPNWTVYQYPADSLDSRSVVLSPQTDVKISPDLWRREVIAGMFVSRSTIPESLDLFDTAVPALDVALRGVDGVTVQEYPEPRAVTVGDVDYLVKFVRMTIETTTT